MKVLKGNFLNQATRPVLGTSRPSQTINVPILTSMVLDCNIGANYDIREATGVEVVIVSTCS